MGADKASRRRFLSFSLKSLFIAIAAFGGGLAWIEHQRVLIWERRRIDQALDESDAGGVLPSEEIAAPAILHAEPGTLEMPRARFPVSFIRRLLGDESAYCIILWNDKVSDSRSNEIAALFPEAIIWRVSRNP